MKNIFTLVAIIATSLTFAQEENTKQKTNNLWSSNRPDGHAPISVMGDHVHHKGEFMFSYRYMNMGMSHLKSGNDRATNSDAFQNYMISPQNMKMNMHMVGAMYAPNNKITLMIMANYIENNMELEMMMNGGMMGMNMTQNFRTSTSGFGDVSIGALYRIFNQNKKSLHANIGVNIPTGSIEAKDKTPMSMGEEVQLPYPMQLGSGSWGTKVGLTYLWQSNYGSFGAQLNSQINLTNNDQDYKFGNKYQATTWVAAKATNWLSASFRFNGQLVEEINGESELINPMMVTTADTKNSGGFYLHYGFGINLMQPKGALKGLRLGAEVSLPLYQDVNGLQLDQSYITTLGLQYAFH